MINSYHIAHQKNHAKSKINISTFWVTFPWKKVIFRVWWNFIKSGIAGHILDSDMHVTLGSTSL